MGSAVLIAARRGDVKIVRAILEEDIFVVNNVLDQALEEGLTCFFEVCIIKPALHALGIFFFQSCSIEFNHWVLLLIKASNIRCRA